jgi:hypothetical protein
LARWRNQYIRETILIGGGAEEDFTVAFEEGVDAGSGLALLNSSARDGKRDGEEYGGEGELHFEWERAQGWMKRNPMLIYFSSFSLWLARKSPEVRCAPSAWRYNWDQPFWQLAGIIVRWMSAQRSKKAVWSGRVEDKDVSGSQQSV